MACQVKQHRIGYDAAYVQHFPFCAAIYDHSYIAVCTALEPWIDRTWLDSMTAGKLGKLGSSRCLLPGLRMWFGGAGS